MKVVNKDLTTLWVVQPRVKSDFRAQNILLIKDEAVSLSKALPGTKLCGSTIVSIEKLSLKNFGKGKVDELDALLNPIKSTWDKQSNFSNTATKFRKNGKLKYLIGQPHFGNFF